MKLLRSHPLLAALALASAGGPARADSFTGIGFFAGEATSYAYGVSADGSTVVGSSGGYIAKWTEGGGIEYVGGEARGGAAYAASADGSTITGTRNDFAGSSWPYGSGAFRWDSSSGYQNLNDPSMGFGSSGLAVTDDGGLVAGERYNAQEGVVWDDTSNATIPGTESIRGLSADGGYRLGVLTRGYGGFFGSDTFRIASDGTTENIGHLTAAEYTYGRAISADGSAIVGVDYRGNTGSTTDPVAFIWTDSSGMQEIGRLAGDASSVANALTTTGLLGSMVVGQSGSRAFLWSDSVGLVDLQLYLSGRGLDLAGWTLTEATGLSRDGLTIVGQGINAAGQEEGWVVRLSGAAAVPEPASFAMLALGGFAAGLAARRSRRMA